MMATISFIGNRLKVIERVTKVAEVIPQDMRLSVFEKEDSRGYRIDVKITVI